ncbi:phosphoribosylformylglycinamidine synthase [Candidatus Fermentibacteria bacterium]|nr:phosphoribosylformylglycinamidine synthase [Candidatus Fermentibacteria bacterium]
MAGVSAVRSARSEPGSTTQFVQLLWKNGAPDATASRLAREAIGYLHLDTGSVTSSKVFVLARPLDDATLRLLTREALADTMVHEVGINELWPGPGFASFIRVAKLPGVTDDEGMSAQRALSDLLNAQVDATQWIHTEDLFYLECSLADADLLRIARDVVGNELVHRFEVGPLSRLEPPVCSGVPPEPPVVETVPLEDDDDCLEKLSKERLLALDRVEMRAIRDHFSDALVQSRRRAQGLGADPTDCELEVLAQTWSEHCKHKEFNALITFCDVDTGEVRMVDSLFATYIKGATAVVQERLRLAGAGWLLSVFSDNAGVVRIDEDRVLAWKVETHNSPSALDPYGGALTGIVGVNRDPMGTGIGGGRCLFNTDVLCFGDPRHEGALLPGQLHPRRVMAGVVKGIEDGGNKSGIPTVNGAVVFDERFGGKPLVYCGTAAVMPAFYQGRPSWEKRVEPGDRIVMAGGRVGRDGIHGATFSSREIGDDSPRSAVQIGSPITQKNLADFLEKACVEGLVRCCTDNGAGGLSSSVGELARLCGGAVVSLEHVPLKYPGLAPWEIFLSESQERMTLVVSPDRLPRLLELAGRFEVEATDIGRFEASNLLDVRHKDQRVALLDMDFLHNGVPRKHLEAQWGSPQRSEFRLPLIPDYGDILLTLMGSLNICSREGIVRRYDHEVKGRTVVKPLMGPGGHAPQDAAVLRLGFDSFAGIAVSNGIIPRYGDIDPYHMSAGAFDEAVRSIIAVGGSLPDSESGEPFWSVNDNFCVPDSVYHPVTNPDGKVKLGKLVRMCEALYDMAVFYGVPLTSGKDSMKNDLVRQGTKISVPPTVLYSAVAGLPDVRLATTSEFKRPGDRIYVVGKTYTELGASEFLRLFGEVGVSVPLVRKEDAVRIYHALSNAHRHRLVASCHDVSDGGLAVALAESALGSCLGIRVDMEAVQSDLDAALFAESHSRFVVSVAPKNCPIFESIMDDDCQLIGEVTGSNRLLFSWGIEPIIDLELEEVVRRWRSGLEGLI